VGLIGDMIGRGSATLDIKILFMIGFFCKDNKFNKWAMNIIKKISFLIILVFFTFCRKIKPNETHTSANVITFFIETEKKNSEIKNDESEDSKKEDNEFKNKNEDNEVKNNVIKDNEIKDSEIETKDNEIEYGKEEKKTFLESFNGMPNVRVVYMGWTTLSDKNGQVILPFQQTKPEITLIVTPSIKPVLLNDTLVSYFILDEPGISYQINELNDEKTKKSYWQITKSQLTKNSKIPFNAIVIFSNPEDIIIPNEQYPMRHSANMVLPKLYASKNQKFLKEMDEIALNFVSISRYFSTLRTQKKQMQNINAILLNI
jgi:hypothetical protein